jgi:antitoxin ParD1/3/4
MTTIRKTITLTEQQGNWIKSRINDGDFTNDSEYLRDLIRRDQEQFSEIHAIRAALKKGEQSDDSARSIDEIMQAVLARKSL